MILESNWHQWKQDQSITLKIMVGNLIGVTNFSKMSVECYNIDGSETSYKIMRTEKNQRIRPNAEQRYQNDQAIK